MAYEHRSIKKGHGSSTLPCRPAWRVFRAVLAYLEHTRSLSRGIGVLAKYWCVIRRVPSAGTNLGAIVASSIRTYSQTSKHLATCPDSGSICDLVPVSAQGNTSSVVWWDCALEHYDSVLRTFLFRDTVARIASGEGGEPEIASQVHRHGADCIDAALRMRNSTRGSMCDVGRQPGLGVIGHRHLPPALENSSRQARGAFSQTSDSSSRLPVCSRCQGDLKRGEELQFSSL